MGQPEVTKKRSLTRPVLTVGVAFAILSATGAPTPKTLARLEGAGLSPDLAAAALHVAPVFIAMAGLAGGLVLSRGRSPLARGVMLGLTGAVIGFLLAMCLDLFVGVLPAMEAVTGPMRDASGLDIAAWSLAAVSILYGAITLAISGFGKPAMEAINFEGVEAACLEVRGRDRGMFAWSSLGLVGQGVAIGALAVLHQIGPEAAGAVRGGAVVAITLGALAFAWSSWSIWTSMDELMRRMSVESYAWSGGVATVGGLVWAVLEALRLAPPLTAYGMLVGLIFVQTMTVFLIAAGFASPAAGRKGAR
jgi:hypothetical protein